MIDRDKFKTDAKIYIKQIYSPHKKQDEEAWENLISVLFLYIDEMFNLYMMEQKNEKQD